jgi:hypothetical protein
MNKTKLEEYREASKGLKFIPLLEKCHCGEQVNITNEWVAVEPLPENRSALEFDRMMISRCKKCNDLFLTEYNFAKTRWAVFGTQHFYLSDLDPKTLEEVTGKKRE